MYQGPTVAEVTASAPQYTIQYAAFALGNGSGGSATFSPAFQSVATQLKAHYGSQFIVSIVPRPYESFYYETAVMMGSACDLVQLQFYDNASTQNTTWLRQWIRDKVNEIVNSYGIPASKIVIGCITYYPEYGAGSNTVATYRDAFLEMEGVYPDLRGVFIWESSLDKLKNWDFASTMGATVLS